MTTGSGQNQVPSTWVVALTAAIRAAFGVIWAVNAYLAWRPQFAAHYVGYLQNAAQGQPDWVQPWFGLWLALVTPNAGLFIWLTRIAETAIAVGLLFGLARKWVYVFGALFSVLIWSTANGFGGPYTIGATNPGPALVYVLVFGALLTFERLQGRSPYSLDYYIEERWPGWCRVAEWAREPVLARTPPRLPWREQALAIAGLVIALVVIVGTLQSALNAPPSTPGSAAAAVSPLSLTAGAPVARARDAALPPLLGTGDAVSVDLVSTDTQVEIASGVTYAAWTYGGTVPGPILHVREGQTVSVTYTNRGHIKHSIDFHAAQVPPNIAYRDVDPGQTIRFSFVAATPGVFVYHCGTAPVVLHIASGMYGAIVVDPLQGLPPADASYVLVQGEWYTNQLEGTLMGGDFAKMMAATPDEVVFNGVAYQYRDHPLPARAGQRIRLYVANAGPNLSTAFHVIGAVFAAVYPDGDPAHALTGVSTYTVAPGQGVVFDLTIQQPGEYNFVDHSARAISLGATGTLEVAP